MADRPGISTIKREQKKSTFSRSSDPPHFSVILCTYNRRNFVLTALSCLRHQTLPYQNFEVIVVDNGSQDDTQDAVNAYIQAHSLKQQAAEGGPWLVQCLVEPKHGLAYARNAGLLAATGEIVVFVDDDTLIDPQMLENLWRAYEETGADAIGMRVMVHWEIMCPHWMAEGLLETLGYFAPTSERLHLAPGETFASCGFSVKREVLRSINYFSPFLSKRVRLPASTEVVDLCRRLHQAKYALWYEPQALVLHRATSARLHRAFFVGRAYWQGRSEVMLQYQGVRHENTRDAWREVLAELGDFIRCLLIQTPLIRLAGRPTTERLLADMEQAHSWGRFIQRFLYLEHVPSELDIPAVLLVHSATQDTSFDLLTSALDKQEVRYLTGQPEIPLGWLWRHRSYQGQPVGILHFHCPGALELTRQQSRYLRFRLWLARRWGLRIVVTDNGGWWQSTRGALVRSRRAFERRVLYASHAILAATNQPNLLYRARRLQRRVYCVAQPGLRGYYPPALPEEEARCALEIAPTANFVYLCLAHLHTEREVVFLLEAFHELTQGNRCDESLPDVHLVLVGRPADCEPSPRLLKLATHDAAVHIHAQVYEPHDLPLYMGACDALVLPHLAVHTSGSLESAALALAYERLVVAPDLPRFSGMLPARASVPYIAASRESLAEALVKAQQVEFVLQEEESAELDVQQSWEKYAKNVLSIYRELLGQIP